MAVHPHDVRLSGNQAPLIVAKLCTLLENSLPRSLSNCSFNRSRKSKHTPETTSGNTSNEACHILTLRTNPSHQDSITALRTKYFPPRLNKLAAHICLFRALPGSRLDDPILEDIESLCQSYAPFTVGVTKAFRMSRGVGLAVADGGNAQSIHAALVRKWTNTNSPISLSKQDGTFKHPHYTIMNFARNDEVVSCMEEIGPWFDSDRLESRVGTALGLQLWRYVEEKGKKGTWAWIRTFDFGARDLENVRTPVGITRGLIE